MLQQSTFDKIQEIVLNECLFMLDSKTCGLAAFFPFNHLQHSFSQFLCEISKSMFSLSILKPHPTFSKQTNKLYYVRAILQNTLTLKHTFLVNLGDILNHMDGLFCYFTIVNSIHKCRAYYVIRILSQNCLFKMSFYIFQHVIYKIKYFIEFAPR